MGPKKHVATAFCDVDVREYVKPCCRSKYIVNKKCLVRSMGYWVRGEPRFKMRACVMALLYFTSVHLYLLQIPLGSPKTCDKQLLATYTSIVLSHTGSCQT